MALSVYCEPDPEKVIRGVAAAFDASCPDECTPIQQATARGFYSALHAVALSFGFSWSDDALTRWMEDGE